MSTDLHSNQDLFGKSSKLFAEETQEAKAREEDKKKEGAERWEKLSKERQGLFGGAKGSSSSSSSPAEHGPGSFDTPEWKKRLAERAAHAKANKEAGKSAGCDSAQGGAGGGLFGEKPPDPQREPTHPEPTGVPKSRLPTSPSQERPLRPATPPVASAPVSEPGTPSVRSETRKASKRST